MAQQPVFVRPALHADGEHARDGNSCNPTLAAVAPSSSYRLGAGSVAIGAAVNLTSAWCTPFRLCARVRLDVRQGRGKRWGGAAVGDDGVGYGSVSGFGNCDANAYELRLCHHVCWRYELGQPRNLHVDELHRRDHHKHFVFAYRRKSGRLLQDDDMRQLANE